MSHPNNDDMIVAQLEWLGENFPTHHWWDIMEDEKGMFIIAIDDETGKKQRVYFPDKLQWDYQPFSMKND